MRGALTEIRLLALQNFYIYLDLSTQQWSMIPWVGCALLRLAAAYIAGAAAAVQQWRGIGWVPAAAPAPYHSKGCCGAHTLWVVSLVRTLINKVLCPCLRSHPHCRMWRAGLPATAAWAGSPPPTTASSPASSGTAPSTATAATRRKATVGSRALMCVAHADQGIGGRGMHSSRHTLLACHHKTRAQLNL